MSDFSKGFLYCLLLNLFFELFGYFERKRKAKKCNYVCDNCKYFPCNKWDCEREKIKAKKQGRMK